VIAVGVQAVVAISSLAGQQLQQGSRGAGYSCDIISRYLCDSCCENRQTMEVYSTEQLSGSSSRLIYIYIVYYIHPKIRMEQ